MHQLPIKCQKKVSLSSFGFLKNCKIKSWFWRRWKTILLPVPLACGRATDWLLCSRVNFFNWLHIIAPQTNGFSRIFRPPLISLTLFYLRERSDPTGLSDYRALHQSAIEAETPLPLCCQPVQMAALSLDWEIKPGPRMHKN